MPQVARSGILRVRSQSGNANIPVGIAAGVGRGGPRRSHAAERRPAAPYPETKAAELWTNDNVGQGSRLTSNDLHKSLWLGAYSSQAGHLRYTPGVKNGKALGVSPMCS